MSKMSRHVFHLIEEGTLPQEIEGFDYDDKDTEGYTRADSKEVAAISTCGYGGGGLVPERDKLGGQESSTDFEDDHLASPERNGGQTLLCGKGLSKIGDAGFQSGVIHEDN